MVMKSIPFEIGSALSRSNNEAWLASGTIYKEKTLICLTSVSEIGACGMAPGGKRKRGMDSLSGFPEYGP